MAKVKKQDIDKAVRKITAVDWLIEHHMVTIDAENSNVCVHYLLWNSLNNSGQVKLTNGLFFYTNAARSLMSVPTGHPIKLFINYGHESNDYGKTGVSPAFRFSPQAGFMPFH